MQIPPFIPDDPEKPHLSSWKKERERRETIQRVLQTILRYRREDWTQEKMNEQQSYFDREDGPTEKKAWAKLAQNLLFSGENKSIVKNYSENLHKIEA